MMFLVFELRSRGMSQRPPDNAVSEGKPLASLHAVMQALQPVQRLLSYSMPTASGGATGCAGCSSAAAAAEVTRVPATAPPRPRIPKSACRRLMALFMFIFSALAADRSRSRVYQRLEEALSRARSRRPARLRTCAKLRSRLPRAHQLPVLLDQSPTG